MKKLIILLAVLFIGTVTTYPQAQVPKVVYLALVDGTGTETDPFHSRGFGATTGVGCIDLRPDSRIATGRMLCAADTLPASAGIVQIGATFLDRLSAQRKTAIETALGVTLTNDNILDVVAELLITHAKTDGTRWRPLQAGRDGKYKIFLGRTEAYTQTAWLYPYVTDHGLVADAVNWLEPAVAWAASLTEIFTATNGNLDGCQASGCTHSWTEFVGTAWTIASNQAVASGSTVGSLAAARNMTALDTVNHRVSATFVSQATGNAADGTNTSCAVLARKEANATQTFYRTTILLQDAGELNQALLHKTVAGSTTLLASDTTDWTANDVVTVYPNGSTISGQHASGALMSVTDTEIAGGTYVGIRYFSDYTTGSPSCTIDNLAAYDLDTFGPLRRRS